MPVNSQGTKTDVLLVTSLTDNYISMKTCFLLSHTHARHKETHTHVHAGDCRWGEKQTYLLQEGKEWRKKVRKKGKRKTRSYTSEQKEKTESKECFGCFFWGGGALSDTEGCVNTLFGFVCTQALQTRGITVN